MAWPTFDARSRACWARQILQRDGAADRHSIRCSVQPTSQPNAMRQPRCRPWVGKRDPLWPLSKVWAGAALGNTSFGGGASDTGALASMGSRSLPKVKGSAGGAPEPRTGLTSAPMPPTSANISKARDVESCRPLLAPDLRPLSPRTRRSLQRARQSCHPAPSPRAGRRALRELSLSMRALFVPVSARPPNISARALRSQHRGPCRANARGRMRSPPDAVSGARYGDLDPPEPPPSDGTTATITDVKRPGPSGNAANNARAAR